MRLEKPCKVRLTCAVFLQGADPNIRDKAAMTAIHYAIDENSESAVNLLLSRGADPTLGNNEIGMDSTPLHTALSRGRHNIALLLLKTGRFDVNQPGDPQECWSGQPGRHIDKKRVKK